jgi:hypothetical protein
VFESTALVADRWTPAVDAGRDEEDTDLDVAQRVADAWAREAAALVEEVYGHGCNEGCDQGCTNPYVAPSTVPEPPTTDAGPDIGAGAPAGTALVADAVASRPAPELAGFLAGVPDLAGLDGWSVVEVMTGYERIARWAAAGQLAAVAELARRYPDPRAGWARDALPPAGLGGLPAATAADAVSGPTFDQATAQVAFALDLPRETAKGLLVDAVALTDRVPVVLARLAAGTISTRVARVIAQDTMVCADPATSARVAEHVLAQPGVRTGPQARKATGAAVIAADPTAAARRERNAHAGRSFRPVKDTTDGMTTWDACLPVAASLAIDRRLTRLAKAAHTPGDPRARAAVRADIATALLLGQPVTSADGTVLSAANLPTPTTWRTDVVVTADTLAGGDQPGQIPGWGPVTAPTARRLAAGLPDPTLDPIPPGSTHASTDTSIETSTAASSDASGRRQLARQLAGDPQWRRLVTDPLSGMVLDYGTTRYRPPQALADFVRARDGHCYEPGCSTRAADCDLDHLINSPAGPSPHPDPSGATADWNLAAGCRTAHRIKAMPGWHVSSPTPGSYAWTTPTGHTYTRYPEPPLPSSPPRSQPYSGAPSDDAPQRSAYGPPPY